MELILFTGAAVIAFALAATPVLLWALARRERQLREALEASLARLAELEAGAPPAPPPDEPPPAFRLPEPPAPPPETAEQAAPPKPRRPWWRTQPDSAPAHPAPEEAAPPPRPMALRPAPLEREPDAPTPLALAERPAPANLPARREPALSDGVASYAEPPAWARHIDDAPEPQPPRGPAAGLTAALLRASLPTAIFIALASGALWAVPAAQLSPTAALVIAAISGLGAIGAGEWFARLPPPASRPAGVAVLVAAGLVIIVAAVSLSARLHAALPPAVAFVLNALAAFAAFAYARRLGFGLFLLALAVSLALPLVLRLPASLALIQHAFLLGVLIFVLWDAAPRPGRRAWRLIAIAGALGWTAQSAYGLSTPILIAPVFGAGLALLCAGLFYAAPDAAAPLPLRAWRRDLPWTERALLGCALAIAATLLLIGFAFVFPFAPAMGTVSVVLAVAIAAIAAYFLEGLGFPALVIASLAAAAIAIWPSAAAPTAISAAAAVAVIATIGGWLAMARARDPTPGALLAALVPVIALLAAYLRFGPVGGADNWASAAAVLAGLNLLLHVRMRSAPRDAFSASVFALGAVLAAAIAIGVFTPAPYNIAALGAFLPILALFDHAANQRGLRIGAGAVALAAILMAVQVLQPHARWPLAPWLDPYAASLAFAAAAMLLSALLFARGGVRAASFIVRILTLLAFAALAAAFAVQLRAAATDGAFTQAGARAWECGAYAVVALALALAAAWREQARPDGFAYALSWLAYAAAALLLAAGALLFNPWWGAFAPPVAGPPIANELVLGYAAPALAALAGAWLFDRWRAPSRVLAMGLIVVLQLALWLALEHRRLFHADAMAAAPIAAAEAWSLTALLAAYAGAAFWLGLRLGLRWLLFAATAVALAALLKAALMDAPALQGAARTAAFAALLAATVAILIYVRRILPPGAGRAPDPNLMPPH